MSINYPLTSGDVGDGSGETRQTFPAHPSVGETVVCRACGHVNPAGTNLCLGATSNGRRCQKALPGNQISRRHGIYAPPSPAFEQRATALVEQSILDAGGHAELTARELAQHEYRGVLHANILQLATALQQHGQFDKRGRLRVAWLSKLESMISTSLAIDRTLGLARRQKRVPTLQEWAAQHGTETTE